MAGKPGFLQRLKSIIPFTNAFQTFAFSPRYSTVWMKADPESFADKGYGSNVYVFSAIRQITTKCAAIPWRVYDVKNVKSFERFKSLQKMSIASRETRAMKDEALEANDAHPLNDLFYNPNYLQTWSEFVESVIAFKHIMGNSFIWGGRLGTGPDSGKIKMIFPISPSVVEVKAGPYPQPVDSYTIHHKPVAKEDMLHLRYFDPRLDSRRIGLSPLEVLLKQITMTNSFTDTNTTLAQNLFRMPGVLSVEGLKAGDKKTRDDIRDQFIEDQSGDKRGLPIVTGATIKWQDIAFNPKDIDWVNGFKITANQIAMGFEMPPELLGDSEHKTYNSMPEAIRYFYYGKIIPEMASLRDGLNRWLVPQWERNPNTIWLDFDINGIEILQEERTAVMDRATKAWQVGLYTMNDALKKIGESEIGDVGNIRLIPMGAQIFSEADLEAAASGVKPPTPAGQQQQLEEAIAYLKKMGVEP
jgi:HK97 family phage portal protein